MKITCQSCQSKYNVADEKVQGKIVKIRCRKCGATIVVNGANIGATNGAGEVTDAPSPASTRLAENADPWHVNLAENDQRTMALAELVEAYNSGLVTHDTFIWTEGMGDWKPLGEVEVVLGALHERASHGSDLADGPAPLAVKPQAPYTAPEAAASAFTSSAPAPYEDPAAFVASAAAAEVAPRHEPRRAAVKREGRARDLFATGLGDSHGTQDMQGSVETSAPLMQGGPSQLDDPNKLTGERNENSVLFSLAVLTKTADERAPAMSDAPSSSREDSGLIDLKALAAKTESMRPAAMADGGIFSSPLGSMPSMGAPLGPLDAPLGDAQPRSKLPRIIGVGAAIALFVVLGMVIGVKFFAGSSNTAATAGSAAASSPSAHTEPDVPTAVAPPAPADSTAPSSSVATSAAKPKPNAAPAWHPQAAAATKAAPAGGGAAAAGGGGATPAPAAAPAKKNDCGCNGDLMCLMKCSTH